MRGEVRVRGSISAAVILGVSSCLSCVAQYNSVPLKVSEADSTTTIPARYDVNPQNPTLTKNWSRIMATCQVVRQRMVRERDGITQRNAVIGAGFAGLAAGMATASGIYSIWKGDDADARVTATLGLGAGAATVPTFWYFGADERERELSERIRSIDERMNNTVSVYKTLKAADREFDRAGRAKDEELISKVRQARQEAQDALDDALIDLSRSCI